MTSCIVTPLQPPFKQDVVKFDFINMDKTLAVSIEDGRKIMDMIAGSPVGREITLAPIPGGGEKIQVYVAQ